MVVEHRTGCLHILHPLILTAALLAQLHDRSDKFRGHHDLCPHQRLFHIVDLGRIRKVGRVGKIDAGSVCLVYLIDNAGRCGDKIQIVLPFQSFLDNLQMQQSKESAAETKSKRRGSFRFIKQRRIVQLEFFQRVSQILVLRAVRRIHSAVNHRIDFFVTRKRLRTGIIRIRDRVAHAGISDILNAGGDITDHSCRQFVTGDQLSCSEISYFYDFLHGSGSHHADFRSFFHSSFHHTAGNNDTAVSIINGIKNQRLQRIFRTSLGRRNLADDLFQNRIHVFSRFGRNTRGIFCLDSNHIFDLGDHALRLGAWQVNLIDDRKNVQVMIQRQINVCKGLRLDSLRGIDHQDRAVTGGKAPGYFVIEVHMARCVNHIQNIFFSILRLINRPDRLRLDGDAAFPFQVHVVQYLILHLALGQQACFLDDAVGKGGFSMINMCNDTKISDFTLFNS